MNQQRQANGVAILAFVVSIVAGAVGTKLANSLFPIAVGVLLGIYLLLAIKVVDQWEKVAVLRFGRYRGLRGPGVFLIIPVLETLSRYVDQRVRVTTVSAESTLTRDTVPVNVDAIIFWLVWNAEKSILEVENFLEAITLGSQTALRESIGRHQLAQMITERETMGHELQRIVDGYLCRLTERRIEITAIDVVHAKHVGDEQAIELAALQDFRQIDPVFQVFVLPGAIAGMRPETRRLMSDTIHVERVEPNLASHANLGLPGNLQMTSLC